MAYRFRTSDDPLASYNEADDINDNNQIVGVFSRGVNTVSHGFLYTAGAFTILDDPLAVQSPNGGTFAHGINNADQIVGHYTDVQNGVGAVHGFLYSGGNYTT